MSTGQKTRKAAIKQIIKKKGPHISDWQPIYQAYLTSENLESGKSRSLRKAKC